MSGDRPDYRLVVFLVGLTQLIITTDFSIVAVALPSIGARLHVPPTSLSWVISAAALSGGGFLIVAGRAADIFGQRACMLVGLSLFATGSLGSALAPDFGVLIAARIVQGLGGAILTPANFSLINTLVPEGAPRHRAMGVFGVMQGLSLVIGLLIGGALTTRFGWRAVFLLNPPIALLAIAITLKAVPARR
jgi:MFS family permease